MKDRQDRYCERIAKTLKITQSQAQDIFFLRTRSRWTEEFERRCVKAMRSGVSLPPVIQGVSVIRDFLEEKGL
jgi:hypothetical protein